MSPSFNKYFIFSFNSDCIFCLVDVLSVVQVSNIRDKDGRVKHLAVWLLVWACINTVIIGVVSLQSCTDIADQFAYTARAVHAKNKT